MTLVARRSAQKADRGLWSTLAPPLLAFACATGLVVAAALVAGYSPTSVGSWGRWDTYNYVNIADRGYRVAPCDSKPGAPICDFAGWLPGYPVAIAGLHRAGLSLGLAGLLVSWTFSLASLVLLWKRFLGRQASRGAVPALAFAAFVPGQIYHHSLFPMSMLVFFALLAASLLDRRRYAWAALAGAGAAFTYPLGVLLAPAFAAWLYFVEGGRTQARRLLLAAGVGGGVAAGFGAVLLWHWLQIGDWNRFFDIQSHGVRPPTAALREAAAGLLHAPSAAEAVIRSQTLFVAAIVALVVGGMLLRRREVTRLDVLLVLAGVLIWIVPLMQTDLSTYRSHAALVVLAPLLRHLRRPVQLLVVTACAVLAFPMAILFFDGKLV